jgi:TonB family protein
MRRRLWSLIIAAAFMTPLSADAKGRSCANLSQPPTDLEIVDNAISKSGPRYPQAAVDQRLEGLVQFDVTISPQGDVTDVKVIKAEPPGVFEQSTIDAVKTWKYCPSGRTITVRLDVTFQLPPEMRRQQ